MDTQKYFIAILAIILVNYFVVANGEGLCFIEHNAARAQNGMSALKYNNKLERAAKVHSDVMARTECYSHRCPEEPAGPSQRIENAGYEWSNYAENIARGQEGCKDVMKNWINSPSHKKNILGDYKDIGCAQANNMWTCDFGTPE